MVNILLEGYNIAAPWLRDELLKYLKPCQRVVIAAFSFRDRQVRTLDDWNALYSPESGLYYHGLTDGFAAYGILPEQISFINCFTDTRESAMRKIQASDILFFPGGLPDRMLERLQAFGLYDVIAQYRGIVMGYSAGAVIQLAEYHLSPDSDYPAFAYYSGFPFLRGFYLEVHYENTPLQNECIRRVLREKRKTVYATAAGIGALIVDNGQIKPLGRVFTFEP